MAGYPPDVVGHASGLPLGGRREPAYSCGSKQQQQSVLAQGHLGIDQEETHIAQW